MLLPLLPLVSAYHHSSYPWDQKSSIWVQRAATYRSLYSGAHCASLEDRLGWTPRLLHIVFHSGAPRWLLSVLLPVDPPRLLERVFQERSSHVLSWTGISAASIIASSVPYSTRTKISGSTVVNQDKNDGRTLAYLGSCRISLSLLPDQLLNTQRRRCRLLCSPSLLLLLRLRRRCWRLLFWRWWRRGLLWGRRRSGGILWRRRGWCRRLFRRCRGWNRGWSLCGPV